MLMNPRVWWSRIVQKILPGSEPRVSSLYLYSWYSFNANPEPICLPEIPWHRAVTCTTGDQVRIISLGHASLRILRQLRWDGHQIGSQPSGQRKQLAWSVWCLARPLTRASWQMEVTEGLVRMVPEVSKHSRLAFPLSLFKIPKSLQWGNLIPWAERKAKWLLWTFR